MSLALKSASRVSNIYHLDIQFMPLSEEKVLFNFTKLLKLLKRAKHQQKMKPLLLRITKIFA